jgi:opacity protein-like surface antigen
MKPRTRVVEIREGQLHRVRIWETLSCVIAVRLLLCCLVLGSSAAAADEAIEPPPVARPDFRFGQPRAIVGIRGGWVFNRSDGDIYQFLTSQLTLDESDFDTGAFSFDVSVRVTPWLDVVTGFEISDRTNKSSFRNFVGPLGEEIVQKTQLTQVPLSFSLKLYPLGRGRQVGEYAWIRSKWVPYIGGGIGGTWYELRQRGDFIVTDPMDPMFLTIFSAELKSNGWGFAQHVFAGIDFELTTNLGLVLEGRYYWAEADLRRDFIGFKPIDLDGARLMIGLSWRL